MNSEKRRAASPLAAVTLSMCAELMIAPFGTASFSGAQAEVWGAVCSTAVALGFAWLWTRQSAAAFCRPFILPLMSAVLFFTAAASVGRAARFCGWSGLETPPALWLYAAAGVCILFALRMGAATVARCAGAGACLLVFSLLLLIVGNAPQLRLENLAQQLPAKTIFAQCAVQIWFPPELPASEALWGRGCGTGRFSLWRRALLLRAALQIALVMGAELVLGGNARMLVQRAHAMARIGGISVFHRLDALHGAIWCLLLLWRACVMLCGAFRCAEKLFHEGQGAHCRKEHNSSHRVMLIQCAGAAAACLTAALLNGLPSQPYELCILCAMALCLILSAIEPRREEVPHA